MGSVCLLLGSGSCSSSCCQVGPQVMHLQPRTAAFSESKRGEKRLSDCRSECQGMRLDSYQKLGLGWYHVCIRLAASSKTGL